MSRWLIGWLVITASCATSPEASTSPSAVEQDQERPRARELGIVIGDYDPGPLNAITDVAGVRSLRDYLVYIEREARVRYEAGMSVAEAARDISLADYASWGDAERIVVNVATLYREFGDEAEPPNPVELFAMMGALARDRAGS